jgi:hypothetical protein
MNSSPVPGTTTPGEARYQILAGKFNVYSTIKLATPRLSDVSHLNWSSESKPIAPNIAWEDPSTASRQDLFTLLAGGAIGVAAAALIAALYGLVAGGNEAS